MSEADFGFSAGASGSVPQARGDDAVITTASGGNSLELRGVYYLHAAMAERMAQIQDDYFVFPQTAWQVTAVEVSTFKRLDDAFGQNAWWGVIDFAEQQGGAFAFADLSAITLVSGVDPEQMLDDAGAQQVEQWFLHLGAVFMDCWAELAQFDVQMYPSSAPPSLLELQDMFPGLNLNTPMLMTSFRVIQPGQSQTARVVLALPQAYLLELVPSLRAIGELTTGSHDTTHFYERLAHIEEVPVPVSVQLGRVTLSVGELQGIEPGDVLALDTALGDPLRVQVGSLELSGKPGTTPDGRRLAVQLLGNSQ
ncbi:MAG: FliM/FliN family flagellar motor switch protein [Candidatus Sericytochromatia bacterium]|nr:FliM/FliN family flagellar motor switch protein [Candidatus Sericytochromatia bacterium]